MPTPLFTKGNPGKPKGAVSQERKFKTWLFKLFLDNKGIAEEKILKMLESTPDLKWLMGILASMCPKEIEHSGNPLSLANVSIKIEGVDGNNVQASQAESVSSFQR